VILEWLEGILKDYPHFKARNGVLILGDSRDVLKRIPSGVVDHVITDPPWGVGFDEYDDFKVFIDVRDELYRVMKPNSWLVFYSTPKRIYDLVPLTQRFEYKWMIPYLFGHFLTLSRNPLGSQAAYSIIMVFAKGSPRVALKRRDIIHSDELPIVEENPRERQFKPTFTTAVLLNMFTRQGDLVLDPFAGYGSIPLVAELFGRKWVGIEIDPERFEIAKRIISEKRVVDIKKMREEIKAGAGKGKGLFGVSL
jgi:DNA modification methylase